MNLLRIYKTGITEDEDEETDESAIEDNNGETSVTSSTNKILVTGFVEDGYETADEDSTEMKFNTSGKCSQM